MKLWFKQIAGFQHLAILFTAVTLWSTFACGPHSNPNTIKAMQGKSFYELSAIDIDGNNIPFSNYRGKKIMVVNVASKCGYTKQYAALQAVYEKYRDKFTIFGFPCNQFLGQEPGTEEDIKTFCSVNYGVTFPMFSKVDVKGENQHPVFAWLTNKSLNGVEDVKVSWNFNKFLIDQDGNYVRHFESGTTPDDPEIIRWIEE